MRSTDFENNQRWTNAIMHSFENNCIFETQGDFCDNYGVGRDFPRALCELGIMLKNDYGKYQVIRKITRKDILSIRVKIKQLRSPEYRNKRKPPQQKIDFKHFNQIEKKPKIETQRDWHNERPTAILSIPNPQPQAKKFRLLWGLLEFEY